MTLTLRFGKHSIGVMERAPRLEDLAIALGFWKERLRESLVQSTHTLEAVQLAEELFALEPDERPNSIVCIGGATALECRSACVAASQGRALEGPLPAIQDLRAHLDQLALQRARHAGDQPRPLADRQLELANSLAERSGSTGWLAPSVKSQFELASQWVDLFDRWDWLWLAWLKLGSPSAPAADLGGLTLIHALYCAQHDGSSTAFWFETHPAPEPSVRPWMVCLGPSDSLSVAKMVVLWGGIPRLAHLPTLPTGHQADIWPQIWPELSDLALARIPNHLAWPSLSTRMGALPAPDLMHVRWSEARSLDNAARTAAEVITGWLSEREQQAPSSADPVGVVAADRLAARRLASMLSHAQIAVDDPAGWALDTTLASVCLQGLLDLPGLVAGRSGFFAWMANPLVAEALNRQALFEALALESVFEGWRAATSDDAALRRLPPGLSRALAPILDVSQGERRPVREWLSLLLGRLDALGLTEVLAEDEAGLCLLSTVSHLRADFSGRAQADNKVPWRSFRALVMRAIAPARLPIRPENPSVRILGITEAARAKLCGLVFLGCSEGQFIPRGPSRLLARAQMEVACGELPARVSDAVLVSHLALAISRGLPTLFVAQRIDPQSPAQWAAPLARLRAFVFRGEGRPADPVLSRRTLGEQSDRPPSMPSVVLSTPLRAVSVSSLQTFARCPYRFYWQEVLGLAEAKDLDEDPGHAELGILLHRLLQGVGAKRDASQPWEQWLFQETDRLAREQESSHLLVADIRARIPSLAEWLEETDQTHRLESTEEPLSLELPRSGVSVRGRIDRIDRDPQGLPRILDVKSSKRERIRERSRDEQTDIQLQAYAAMVASNGLGTASQLGYLSVSHEGTELLPVNADSQLMPHVDDLLVRVLAGAPLRPLEALGAGEGCEKCPAEGVCRPSEWMGRGAREEAGR